MAWNKRGSRRCGTWEVRDVEKRSFRWYGTREL
jgi:hypothetical protein